MVHSKHAIVLSLHYCVISKIYSCDYTHVGSDRLTVYFVIYHDNVATVMLIAISICEIYFLTLLLLFCYCNLKFLHLADIVPTALMNHDQLRPVNNKFITLYEDQA